MLCRGMNGSRLFEGAYCVRNVRNSPPSYIASLWRNTQLYSTIEPHIRCHYSGSFGHHVNIKNRETKSGRYTGERACLPWSSLILLVKIFRAVKVIRIFISLFEKACHRVFPVYIFTTLSNAFWIVHRWAGELSLLFQAFKTLIRAKSRHDFIM
jgi:hypothetical protein